MLPKLDVIASRFLELRHEDGTSSPVVVRIGRPRRDDVDYRCDYEVEGLSEVRALHVRGIDDVQALWLALVGVGVELRSSDEGKAGRITFNGKADLGFPSADQLTEPEWHPFIVDGETLHWRTYPSWQQTAEETLTRCCTLEVARRPNALGVGRSYPFGTVVGQEQAHALVRLCREQGTPIL
jgi:hypothetical protein